MLTLTSERFAALVQPGPRLPSVIEWLRSEIWAPSRFESSQPEVYLSDGEKQVYELEELLSTSGDRFYDELAGAAAQARPLLDALGEEKRVAIVIFDGASLRELPLFLQLAVQSGYGIVDQTVSYAALPSNTVDFVHQRLLSKPVAPNELPHRKDLKEKGVRALYYDAPIRTQQIVDDGKPLLLWSAFPDVTYKDSGARFARHFAELLPLFETVWKNTVMQVPHDYRIIISSDHGYIFFGAGLESIRPDDVCELIGQERSKWFAADEPLPADDPDLQILRDRGLAMLRGRIKNRPQGPSGNRLYRHGGLSLMEMLVPWIVLEKK